MDNKPVRTSIIIPAYNEETGLPVTLHKLSKLIDASYEVIIVDDGSTDKTPMAISQYPYQVIKHHVNQGKGAALKSGIKLARSENIIWIDADDSYPVAPIPRIAEALNGNYDAVVCSRVYGRNYIPTFNRVGLWLFRVMIQKIYGFKPKDPCTGLYGVRKKHLINMELTAPRFTIEPEISIKSGRMKLKTLEIPIKYQKRIGYTKLNSIKVGWEDLVTILSLIFWRPKR